MFRFWAKEFKENHMIRSTVIKDDSNDTRTHKIFHAIDDICREFDIQHPIWLDSCTRDFKTHSKTRFYQDSFIEEVPFDYLEIQVIEEDTSW